MLTKTIGQLDTEVAPSTADYLEIEHSGTSGKVTASAIVDLFIATSAESSLATSNSVLMTPLQVREAFNATNEAPVYACRAFVTFNGATVSSSISGTYTRIAGTTQTICVATGHNCITGNIQYIDFTSGTGSDNSYIVTVIDNDSFYVNTVSTSSVLTSAFTIKRCPILKSGNVNNVSYKSTGQYHINFAVKIPTNSSPYGNCGDASLHRALIFPNSVYPITEYTLYSETLAVTPALVDVGFISIGVIG